MGDPLEAFVIPLESLGMILGNSLLLRELQGKVLVSMGLGLGSLGRRLARSCSLNPLKGGYVGEGG